MHTLLFISNTVWYKASSLFILYIFAKLSYKIYSQKVSDPDSAAEYTIDHVSLIFLMDKEGKFANVFTHNSTTEDIILGLRNFKKSN